MPETGIAKQQEPTENSILSIIAKAASDPTIDVNKMLALLEMQERIMATEREIAFNKDMAAMEPDLPAIQKTKKVSYNNTKYNYAPNEEIDTAIRPLLRKHNFTIYFDSEALPTKGMKYIGFLKHTQGHTRSASLILESDTTGSKNSVQAIGSTTSYARRYLTCMLLNLITKDMADDDGIKSGALTQAQIGAIEALIEESGADRARFLKVMGTSSVEDIQQHDYVKATVQLTAKMSANKKK